MSDIQDAKLALEWCKERRKQAVNFRMNEPEDYEIACSNLKIAQKIYDDLIYEFLSTKNGG